GFIGKAPPQIPIWNYASAVLQPFCDFEAAKGTAQEAGTSLQGVQGLAKTPATCEVIAVAENSKINVNDPLIADADPARLQVSSQLFTLFGGFQSQGPYDALFARRDSDGLYSKRGDIVSAFVDWWDFDTERSSYDPRAGTVHNAGPEVEPYSGFETPYKNKNAPFDSLEEIRMIRGVDDVFWATFVEPQPDDPQARVLTVYGSGAVNPNEAPPAAILATVCQYLKESSLCADPLERAKFVQLVDTARMMAPVPFFSRPQEFLDFLEGKGGERDLYPMLVAFLGQDNPLVFRPVQIPNQVRPQLQRAFATESRMLSIHAYGQTRQARVRVQTVVNFDPRWTPPPPSASRMPRLGVVYYHRVD
ncbi:MAG: hypothetical protein ACPGUV_03965, partial [Polyangiales bacterium]